MGMAVLKPAQLKQPTMDVRMWSDLNHHATFFVGMVLTIQVEARCAMMGIGTMGMAVVLPVQ